MGDYVRKDVIEPIGTCDYSGFPLVGLIWLSNMNGAVISWSGQEQ